MNMMEPGFKGSHGGKPRVKPYKQSLVPWIPIICSAILAGGLTLWAITTQSAGTSTKQMFSYIGGSDDINSYIQTIVYTSTIVVCAVVGSVAIIVLALAVCNHVKSARTGKPERGGCCGVNGYMFANSFCGLVVMALLLAILLMFGFEFLCMGAALGTNRALTFGLNLLNAAPAAVQAASAQTALLANQLLSSVSTAPTSVQATSWWQTLNAETSQLQSSNPDAIPICPSTCLDLGSFAQVLAISNRCVCGQALLTAMRDTSDGLYKDLILALVGLTLILIGGVGFLMHLSSSYAHAQRNKANMPKLKYYETDDTPLEAPAQYVRPVMPFVTTRPPVVPVEQYQPQPAPVAMNATPAVVSAARPPPRKSQDARTSNGVRRSYDGRSGRRSQDCKPLAAVEGANNV